MHDQGSDWRSQPPAAGPPREWSFPAIHRTVLPGGLRVLVARHNEAPLAAIRVVVRSGASVEPVDRAGLASMTASLLDEGAGDRTAIELAEEVARLGAYIGSGADWDASYVALDVLSRNLRKGLEIVRDVVCRPRFDQQEIDRLRQERLTTIVQQKDDPAFIAAKSFSGRLYEGIRYGTPMIGTEDSLPRITRDDVVGFYRRVYTPSNVSVIVTGSIDPEEAVEIARELFGDWEGASDAPFAPETPERRKGTRLVLVDRPGSVQSEIRVGHIGVDRATTDYFPLLVMNALLGEVFNSRIMLNLRERHGYTYGARSSFVFRKHPGPFVVSTAVRSEVTVEAIREIFHELERIRSEEISDEELEHTKNYLMGVFPATVESASDLASRIQELELYGLPDDYFDEYRERIRSVSRHDAARAAESYIAPDEATIVVVGEARDLFDRLAELGHPSEVVDIDGNPVVER